MENLKISCDYVQELEHEEVMETEGGGFWLGVLGGGLTTFLYEVVNDWDANVAAYNEGLNGY